MLDQKVAAARPISQKATNFLKRDRIDLAAFRRARRPTTANAVSARGRRNLHIH
ncbi:hypothetical protein [Pseudolabrys sp.]|uniref:hypothetical protein n=1 Tax=Pseudolabrys sp. TaxID=1960880 RepID=UPI003D0F81DF